MDNTRIKQTLLSPLLYARRDTHTRKQLFEGPLDVRAACTHSRGPHTTLRCGAERFSPGAQRQQGEVWAEHVRVTHTRTEATRARVTRPQSTTAVEQLQWFGVSACVDSQ